MITCNFCKYEFSNYATSCEHCGQPSLYPNVHRASEPEEIKSIDKGYTKVLNKAKNGIETILQRFESEVRTNSNAILVRPISEVNNLFSSLNNLHQTFHQRLNAGGLRFDGKGYDENRPAVDAKLFPKYSENISFAALSLEGIGAKNYGGCHMTLNTPMISHRASVFKGNSYHILSNMKLAVDKPVSKGLRTTWEYRGKLASSKLAKQFKPTTTESDFQEILINNNDFIEVHVFGSISHRTIEMLTVCGDSLAKDKTARLDADALKAKINKWENSVKDWNTKFKEI